MNTSKKKKRAGKNPTLYFHSLTELYQLFCKQVKTQAGIGNLKPKSEGLFFAFEDKRSGQERLNYAGNTGKIKRP
jgi:hypothetical protein